MSHNSGIRESQIRLKALPAQSDQASLRSLVPISGLKAINLNTHNQSVQPNPPSQANAPDPSRLRDKLETIHDPHSSMVYLVDLIFDFLQFYADETNKLNRGTSLQLDWQRPVLEKNNHSKSWLTTSQTTPDLPAFVGKVSTRDWRLFIKGTSEHIMFYVIPANRTISFSTDPELYTPYLSINFYRRRAEFSWQIDSKRISSQHVPALAKTLLEKLLKCARNQVCHLSAFSLAALDLDSLPIDQDSSTGTEKKTKSEFGEPPNHQEFLRDLQKTVNSINTQTPQFLKQSDPAPRRTPGLNELISQKTKPPEPDKITGHEETFNQVISNTELPFEETLKLLLISLESRLLQITREGRQALDQNDFKGAQDSLALTTYLNKFKDHASEVLSRVAQKVGPNQQKSAERDEATCAASAYRLRRKRVNNNL